MAEEVINMGFIIGHIALVSGLAEYSWHFAGRPAQATAAILTVFFYEHFGNSRFSVPLGVQIKDSAYRFRLFLIDYISSIHTVIADNITAAIEYTFLTAHLLSGFYALTGLAAFILGNARHNGQANFSIAVHCPDAIIYKIDFHAVLLQFACGIQCIHRVACKPRQFTSDNQVKAVFLCVLYHPHKWWTFLHLGTGYAFVYVLRYNGPVGIA